MEINAIIEGERQVSAVLDRLDGAVRIAVREKIAELIVQLEARVRANAPVGKTGHLKAEVHSQLRESNQSERIVGLVTDPVAYIAPEEFGIHKELFVRGHQRMLDHVFATPIAPEEVFVDPYTRLANVEATFFMQAALASMEPEIVEGLRAAIDAVSAAHSDGV
jgi:hypothetical protein